jgi:hypothetical protein
MPEMLQNTDKTNIKPHDLYVYIYIKRGWLAAVWAMPKQQAMACSLGQGLIAGMPILQGPKQQIRPSPNHSTTESNPVQILMKLSA